MQFLIDSTQETPASLRFIAATLCALADTYGPPIDSLLEPQPSINGPAGTVTLFAPRELNADRSIDPRPDTVWAGSPDAVFGQPNVETLFNRAGLYAGVIHQNVVPAGTTEGFPPPAVTPTAPQVPAGSMVSAPPAPTTIPPSALPAMTIAETTTGPVQGATLPPVQTATLDKDGIPWDARVHSETRKANADGTWRYRRNLDPNVKATVTAELNALYQNKSASGPQLFPLPSAAAPPPPGATGTPHVPAPVAPQPPVPLPDGISVGLPNAPQPPAVPIVGFRDLMSKVNKARATGKLTEEQLNNACRALNIDSMTALAQRPAMVPLVDAQINAILGTT